MSVFGLDIGSTTLKMVEVKKEGGKFRIVAAGLAPTPQPGVSSEAEKDVVAVSSAIKKLHQDARISSKEAMIALPESQVFSRVVELPRMNDNELAQAVPWQAEQFIPLPLEQVNLDWQVVAWGNNKKGGEKIKVLLVAAPLPLIQKYVRYVELAGFKVAGIETEIIASTRALISPDSLPTMLIDFGARTTNLAVVYKDYVLMTRSIQTAGEAFTRAVATSLSLTPAQAEEYKITYGLGQTQLEGKVRKALAPIFEVVIIEIKKAIAFWKENEEQPVSLVILGGGSANLPEVAPFLTQSLGIEVQIGDPFSRLIQDEQVLGKLRPNAPLFVVAVGLAEKEA